jgi:hypothetical protein
MHCHRNLIPLSRYTAALAPQHYTRVGNTPRPVAEPFQQLYPQFRSNAPATSGKSVQH